MEGIPVKAREDAHATEAGKSRLRVIFSPVDIAPLIFFRVTFGFLMALEICRYLFGGMLRENWIESRFHFTYFDWVPVPPPWAIYGIGSLLLAAAIGITVGLFYRVCALLFGVLFTWLFLIEQSHYLNHFYLICLLSFVAAIVPANREMSLDVSRNPEIRSQIAPAWSLWIVQVHMAIAYFYGGIAKLNADWLRGEPIRTWMRTGGMSERLPDILKNDLVVYVLSYGGVAFDLLIVPLLLFRKTRLAALIVAIGFHLANARLFSIGLFPFISIALTLLFLSPEWHRKFLKLDDLSKRSIVYWKQNHWVGFGLGIYLTIQLLVPFRHWVYPGNVHWTEEGHRFSWHMMLRAKSGETYFIVRDRAQFWRVDPRHYLTPRQYRKLAGQPRMILQLAHYFRDQWKPHEVAVYAVAWTSLNNRPLALLIDPQVDLARVKKSWGSADWILPLGNARTLPTQFENVPLATRR